MRAPANSSILRAVQVLISMMLVGTSLLALAWMTGYNGFGVLPRLPEAVGLRLQEVNGVPSEPVLVDGAAGVATAAAGNAITGGINGTLADHDVSDSTSGIRPGDGTSEFYGNQAHLSFWALTKVQHVAWVAVRVVPLVGVAAVWWLLFLLVGGIRRGSGFTAMASRRIATIGLVLAAGTPVVQVARWLVAKWLVESSTAASIADPVSLRVALWPIVVGVVVMVVAVAWREAAKMRTDLQGLV